MGETMTLLLFGIFVVASQPVAEHIKMGVPDMREGMEWNMLFGPKAQRWDQ